MKLEHYKSNYESWYYLDKNDNKVYHRDDDLPAIIYPNRLKVWYQHGKFHREIGAAREYSNEELEYWYHGKFLGRSYEGYTQEKFKQYIKLLLFL